MARVLLILAVTACGYQDYQGKHHLRAFAKETGKQVFFFRHCIRSTGEEVKGVDGFHFAKNFTNLPLPNWETPTKWCTLRGAEIMEHIGNRLASSKLSSATSQTIRVISDTKNRDATSANYLMQGIHQKNLTFDTMVEFLPLVFNSYDPHTGAGVCHPPDEALHVGQSAARLSSIAMPMGVGPRPTMNLTRFQELLQELQGLIGQGVAGPLKDLPLPEITPEKGIMMGAVNVIKLFAQNMIYGFGSGIKYTKATLEQRHAWSSWIHYQRQVVFQTPAVLAVKKACGILKVIGDLKNPIGDSIYVGHDDDLDALAMFFDVSWEAPPWGTSSPTPPGSALTFRVTYPTVEVEFIYPTFDGSAFPQLNVVRTTPPTVDLGVVEARAVKLVQLYAGQPCIDACRGARIF